MAVGQAYDAKRTAAHVFRYTPQRKQRDAQTEFHELLDGIRLIVLHHHLRLEADVDTEAADRFLDQEGALVKDERLLRQVGRKMFRRGDEDQLVTPQSDLFERGIFHRQVRQKKIDLAGAKIVEKRRIVASDQPDLHSRSFWTESAQKVRDHGDADVRSA